MKRTTTLALALAGLLIATGLSLPEQKLGLLAIAHEATVNPNPADPHKGHHPGSDPITPTSTVQPLFKHLGNYQHRITTANPLAQRYFNQGLILAYGFNHAAAARSFKQAIALDPSCAMCHWGVALVLGPNINAPMQKDDLPEAWQHLQKAIALSQNASTKEQVYIQALAKRYPAQHIDDRKPFDLAYAAAMREVVKRYPDDLDAATLFAEALMDTTPWDYWQDNGQPKPEGAEIMATLESVLKRNPNHPGANHLYIHAVEKERPELGVVSADRLMNLVPAAGHLVHMASHIYIRVGRYQDAVLANQRGIAADDAYIAQCQAQGMYPLAYMPHNHHFLWFAALMSGQGQLALQAAEHTAKVDTQLMRKPELAGTLQHFYVIPLFTYTRLGQWNKILSTPAPGSDLQYPTGIWHYARGMALLATNRPEQAATELHQLRRIAAEPAMQETKIFGNNSFASVLNIATEVLAGELAAQQGNYSQAIAHLQTAVKLEDALTYTEPADWYQPTRQILAGLLLKANRPTEAEQVYRQDLKIYPENGWSLYGLAQSLQAQGKSSEATATQKRLATAWQHADLKLTAAQL
uniref:TPR repeat-containing protein n=1 Tax=Cyanothece sp. (strain PCC 7425 / ATCC 29141) TaxID=395961 RepID=B8HJT8_CYAP4